MTQVMDQIQKQNVTDFQASMQLMSDRLQQQHISSMGQIASMIPVPGAMPPASPTPPSPQPPPPQQQAPLPQPQPVASGSSAAQTQPFQMMNLIDTRVLGKPSSFSGDDEDPKMPWASWSFVARAYFAALDGRMSDMLAKASALSESPTTIDNVSLAADEKQLSTTLYYALCLMCKDSALGIVKTVPEGSGFEAWRKLTHAYSPKVASRFQSMMEQVLYPTRPTTQHLKAIREWEDLIRRYEAQTGETISDMVRMATLTHRLVDDKLMEHLILNARPNQVYREIRDIVESVYVARRTWNETAANAATDMDVDAIFKGGKGNKKGKSKDKGKAKGTKGVKNDKGKDAQSTQGKCHYCGASGHYARDCRKKARDEKGGKGKPSDEASAKEVQAITNEGFVFMVSEVPRASDDILIDSGAARSVCTPAFATHVPLQPTTTTTILRDASGKELAHYGSRRVTDETESSQKLTKQFEVRAVKRNILSVAEIVDAGGSVVFSPTGCYIELNVGRLEIVRKDGVFVLPVRHIHRDGQDVSCLVAPVTSSTAEVDIVPSTA